MKKATAVIFMALLFIAPAGIAAVTRATLYETTPSLTITESGSGWVSKITLLSNGNIKISVYDTNASAAATAFTKMVVEGGNYTAETQVITFEPEIGSYWPFDYGLQVSATGYIGWLKFAIRDNNGSGGY